MKTSVPLECTVTYKRSVLQDIAKENLGAGIWPSSQDVYFPYQCLPANVRPGSWWWWLKWLGPCHLHWGPGLSSQLLTLNSMPALDIADMCGVTQQIRVPSHPLPLLLCVCVCVVCGLSASQKFKKILATCTHFSFTLKLYRGEKGNTSENKFHPKTCKGKSLKPI